MRVTIRDIAKHANTSVATVSYVLNNSPNHHISEVTRERVLKSVEELHYIPNVSAKSFKTGERNVIGFIGPVVGNYFWSEMAENMEQELSNNGYHLIITNARESADKELKNIRLLSSGMIDGLIIESTLTDCSLIDQAVPNGFPVIVIDRALKNCNHDSIYVSNYTCLYQGVSMLISAGHTKIGYIGSLRHLSTTKERLSAYQNAITDHHLPIDPAIIITESEFREDLGAAIEELIKSGCTALTVASSRITNQTAIWLKQHGLEKKIALLGSHDNTNDFCFFDSFGLISQPAGLLGKKAAEFMLNRIRHPDAPLNILTLQSELHLFNT